MLIKPKYYIFLSDMQLRMPSPQTATLNIITIQILTFYIVVKYLVLNNILHNKILNCS